MPAGKKPSSFEYSVDTSRSRGFPVRPYFSATRKPQLPSLLKEKKRKRENERDKGDASDSRLRLSRAGQRHVAGNLQLT